MRFPGLRVRDTSRSTEVIHHISMSASIATGSWSLLPGSPRGGAWRFGHEVELDGAEGGSGPTRALQWLLKRNCSITPRELGRVYLSLCAVSLAIACFFFVQGATLVLAFAGLELVAVGVALLVFARHAADRETLTLIGRKLQVEQCFGNRVARADFSADWLTVEPAAGQGSLVQLSGRGQTVRVGRFVRPELRADFARELRRALRQTPGPSISRARPATDSN
jgi:uncharacterized membrane protein